MSKKKIAFVGCGALGQEIARRIVDGTAGNYELAGVYTNKMENARKVALEFQCTAYGSLQELYEDQPDILIEAANGSVLRECLTNALMHHIDVIPLSLGVFADKEYLERITSLASEERAHVYFPSGAVGGFDLMMSAALDHDLSASICTEKPPIAFADASNLENHMLSDTEKEIIFTGNADNAIKAFPKNVNVAVAVGLATISTDRLKVTVASNPKLTVNTHTIELEGDFGSASVRIAAKASRNAHSSKLAAYSVVSLLKRLDSWVGFF